MNESEQTGPSTEQEPKRLERPIRNRYRVTKLEKLNCWPEVLAMIENGDGVSEIVAHIQVTNKEYLEVGPRSLQRIIHYWMTKHPEATANRLPTCFIEFVESAPRIDPLDGLNVIAALQFDRVNWMYATERRQKSFNPKLEKEFHLLQRMLVSMAEVESKRKRYAPPAAGGSGPTLSSQLEQLRQIYTNKYGSKVARVILSDESRRKVLNALEHVRKGDSEALNRILDRNQKKSVDLAEQELRRAADEANTIDVEPVEGGE